MAKALVQFSGCCSFYGALLACSEQRNAGGGVCDVSWHESYLFTCDADVQYVVTEIGYIYVHSLPNDDFLAEWI